MTRLAAVYPISDEEIMALPVKSLDVATRFYEMVLRFSVLERSETHATVQRDAVTIGLVQKDAHEPGKAGSVAIKVEGLEELHEDLDARGFKPGEFGMDEWNGREHKTFFLREDEEGYCFCFFRDA